MKKVGKIGSVFVWQSGNLIPVKGQFLIPGQVKKTKLPEASKSLLNKPHSADDEASIKSGPVVASSSKGELKDGVK